MTSSKIIVGLLILIPFYQFKPVCDMNYTIDPTAEVKKALGEQISAWNNGDLEKAMSYYWNSAEILWVSKAGIMKGYQPVLEDFKKEFADTSKMGTYSYELLHIEKVSGTAVYFVIRWKIVLNNQKIMGGVSSQLWKKIKGNWVITAEHAS
jgi:ketosteroid isomerase-like protein